MTTALSTFAVLFLVIGAWVLASIPLAILIGKIIDLGEKDECESCGGEGYWLHAFGGTDVQTVVCADCDDDGVGGRR